MVLLESVNLPIHSKMPEFNLQDALGKTIHSNNIMGSHGLLVLFTCNHCPYAIAIWNRVIKASEQFKELGVNTVAINPNINPNYPADSPQAMKKMVIDDAIPFPYLVDQDQSIAKQYNAQCTPDLYLLAPDMTLFYHGRFDDNWQNEDQVQSHDCANAINLLVSQQSPPTKTWPSMGCSIKWLT